MTDHGAAQGLPRVSLERLSDFSIRSLVAAGADRVTARDATRVMLHASRMGVDSHGIRLLPHYDAVLRGGRVNGRPKLRRAQMRPGSGLIDADNGHGAVATFSAADFACSLAQDAGIGAVGVQNSSHFGAAGAYALAIAKEGMIGIVTCNSDSFVRLHDGAERFHGTNPISVAAPTGSGHPWFLDMATSAVPYNRVQLYRSTGQPMPDETASDHAGYDTHDPCAVEMLAPLGGAFGFKGAGLAGVVEVLSAALTGMAFSPEILPMPGPDLSTPRGMGAFVIAIDPDGFIGRAVLLAGMDRYVSALRGSKGRDGAQNLAPGDREWREAADRDRRGVPIDPATEAAFYALAEVAGLSAPRAS